MITLINGDINSTITSVIDLRKPPSAAEIWGLGTICIVLITLSTAVGIAILPFLSKKTYERVLTFFIGVGVSSLTGAGLFYLIPETFVDDIENKSYLIKSWMVMIGFYIFFVIGHSSKFVMAAVKVIRAKWINKRSAAKYAATDGAGDGTVEAMPQSALLNCEDQKGATVENGLVAESDVMEKFRHSVSHLTVARSQESGLNAFALEHCHGHAKSGVKQCPSSGKVSSVAWMVIFGDGLHKFVDGLTIGSGFSQSTNSGLSISLAIICEEFSHKLGEVAILLNAGMRWQQALFYTLIAGVPLYMGFVAAVFAQELANTSQYVIPLAAGIFLYVALALLIPELNEKLETAMKVGIKEAAEMFALQILGIVAGLVITFFTALYGSQIQLEKQQKQARHHGERDREHPSHEQRI